MPVRIDFHYIHTEPTSALEDHARKSFESLSHVISGLDPEGTALLKLEFVRTTQHHHKGQVYEVKAQLSMPKKVFHADAEGEDLHTILDSIKHKLMHLLEKHKGQATAHRAA